MRFLPGLLALCGLGLCSPGSLAAPMPVSAGTPGLNLTGSRAAAPATAPVPAGATATTPQAADDEGHEHGVARLTIRVEGDLLALRLRVPLQAVLGHETAPRTARQRQAVRQMAATLHHPQSLFVPTAAAGCTAGAVTLRSDAIDPRLLAADPAAGQATGTPAAAPKHPTVRAATPAHADLHAEVDFRCTAPQALNGLQVRMFEVFPGLRQIDTAIVTPRGDSGTRLSPNRTGLTW